MAARKNIRKSLTPEQDDLLAAGAYTLPLESGQMHMTMELLKAHCTLSADELEIVPNIKVKYHSYEQGIVTILSQMPDRSRYRIQFRVGLDNLAIACRCGETKYRLCVHAYTVLYRTLWLHGHLDLAMYYWPQIDNDDQLQAKFLEVTTRNDRIYVEPRLRFGNLYRPGLGFRGAERLKLTEPIDTKQKVYGSGEIVIGFCLAYNYRGFSTSHQPVLIPFVGVLNKTGEEIIRFNRFVWSENDIGQIELSDSQRTLGRISEEQNALVKRLSELNTEQQIAALPEMRKVLFALWQDALPLLVSEQFVYCYNTHKHGSLKQRPYKTGMERCSFSLVKAVLSFKLKFYSDHYILNPRVTINGKTLNLQHNPDFFMFDDEQKQFYLLNSLQDDDILAWMSYSGNKLTIIRKHYDDFKVSFLHPLGQCYKLFFISKIRLQSFAK
jgi:hypothetical protein